MPIQVLLADDHGIFLCGLRLLLEREGMRIVGEVSDGQSAVRLAAETRPDVAVLDLVMPSLNGLGAVREIARCSPGTKTVILSMYDDEVHVLEALRAGVSGYVLKTQAADDLVQAIREVVRGSIYLSTGVSRALVDAYRARTDLPPDPLSRRERQVLQLVAEGKTTKETATLLGISIKTAESHRMRIMSKLDIHGTAGLVRYAIRRGLIQP